MIERVARVFCERHVRDGMSRDWSAALAVTPLKDRVMAAVEQRWREFERPAWDAIAAMREPTEEMIAGAWIARSTMDEAPQPGQTFGIMWRTMIDAALSPSPVDPR